MVIGAIFVDFSAAYDTINQRKLLHKLLEITKDSSLTNSHKLCLVIDASMLF